MATEVIAGGTAHPLPPDMKKALIVAPAALKAWQSLTPLARNEWICWTVSVKQAETRQKHLKRFVSELQEGKRRPCCWLGCVHRADKAISPSAQWVLVRQPKSK